MLQHRALVLFTYEISSFNNGIFPVDLYRKVCVRKIGVALISDTKIYNLHYWIGAFEIEFSLMFGPQVDKDLKEFQRIDWVIEKHLIHVDVRLCCLFSVNFL